MAGGITGDFGELDAILRALDPDRLREDIGRRAGEKIAAIAAGQYAAGQGPDGQAWPLTKDGEIALQGVTSEIVFRSDGDTITASGPDVLRYHEATRPVFPPAGTLSEAWARAAEEAAGEVLSERLGGR